MDYLFKTVFFLFLGLGSLSAQGLMVQGGLNNSKLNYSRESDFLVYQVRQGFQIGVFKDLSLRNQFYFQLGLLAQRKGGKIFEDSRRGFTGSRILSKTVDDIYTLGIPLSFGKNIGLQKGHLFFQLGPIINLNLFGISYTEQISSNFSGEEIKKIEFGSEYGDFKRYEVSSIYQAGFAWKSFKAGLQYEHGMTNLFIPLDDSKIKTRVLSFVFGYTFRKK